MALQSIDGLGDRLRCGEEAESPSGHTPRFSKTVNDNGMIFVCLTKGRDALYHGTVVGEVFVDFVAHNQHPFFDANIAESFNFIRSINRTGWVTRRIQNKESSPRGNSGAELIWGHLKLGTI